MAGTSKTFAASPDGATLKGAIDVPGRLSGKLGDMTVNIKGTSKSATTDEDGFFEISGLSPGSYTIHADGPNLIATEGTLTIAADGSAAIAIENALPGDVNEDQLCDIADFVLLKKCYGKASVEGDCVSAPQLDSSDFNKDGVVDITDFVLMKKAFGKAEPGL